MVSLATNFLSNHIWSLLILCLAIYVYLVGHEFLFDSASFSRYLEFQQPQVFSGLIKDWIGLSDHWETAPLAEGPQFLVPRTRLEADTTKQQAVVQAFKVSTLYNKRVSHLADLGSV